METINILVLHPSQMALRAWDKEDTFAAPGVKFEHKAVSSMDQVRMLAGLRFAAVIGLEWVSPEARDWIKAHCIRG